MENRISKVQNGRGQRDGGPQLIGVILAELLAQYQTRFREVRISVVQTPVAAV